MIQVSDQNIIDAASHASLPPALLLGVVHQQGQSASLNLPEGTLNAYGVTAQQAKADPLLVLDVAARTLSQQYAKYGNMSQALSAYLTGDPQAGSSPTSSMGGLVESILAAAAIQPEFGLQQATPADQARFNSIAAGMATEMEQLVQMGGVITPQVVQQFRQAAAGVAWQGGGDRVFGDTRGLSSTPANRYGFSFGALPFDPSQIDNVSQPYGGTVNQPGGVTETGNDIGLRHGSAVQAPVTGTVHVDDMGASGTGLTLYITGAFPGKVYLGHLGTTSVREGQTVTAGQQVATSGGAPGLDRSPGNSSGPHIEVGYIDAHGQFHDPRPLLVDAFRTQYATDVLKQANMPVTARNIDVIKTMAVGENMDPGGFNLLATTQGGGAPTQRFPSYSAGVSATAATINNGNYPGLLEGLRSNAPPSYYTTGAGAQSLRTWQGGSSEDINLLGQQADPGVEPGKIAEFAAQLQANNIDPSHFAEHFPSFAEQRRRLFGAKRTDVSDFAPVAGLDRTAQTQYLLQQPHPVYPDYTVDQMLHTQQRAQLLSVLHTQQMPTDGEVARMVGLDWKQMDDYYRTRAQSHLATPVAPTQTAPQSMTHPTAAITERANQSAPQAQPMTMQHGL